MSDEDETTEEQVEDEVDEQDEQNEVDVDEIQNELDDARDENSRLRAMLAHYLPDGVDLDEEIDFAVKGKDDSYKYRPVTQKVEAKRSKRSRRQPSTRKSVKAKDIGEMDEDEFDAYLKEARKAGVN